MTDSSTPLVSVCVTTFNHERWLGDALDAILAQRCNFGVEIILGEDCSTDNTRAICQEYAERYPDLIHPIFSERNVGWRENYRRCVEAARGKYIAFCDGDDYFCNENRLSEQVALLEQNPKLALCYTLAERRDATGRLIEHFPKGVGHTTLDMLLRDWCIENCTTLARRDLIVAYYEVEKPEHHPEWLTEDLPMWLFVAAHAEVAYLDYTTAVHRIFDESVSHSSSLAKRVAFCDSSSNIKLWFDSRYNGKRGRRRLLRERLETALWAYSHIGTVANFVRRWWREIEEQPLQIFNPKPYGLLLKKVLWRRWQKRA